MGAVAVLATLAVAAGAMSHHASKDNAVSGAAWYAEAPPPSSASVPAGHAAAAQLAANDATSHAKGMSKAFHEAASKVLPCVVMITNTPAMAEKSAIGSLPPTRTRRRCRLVSRARPSATCSTIRSFAVLQAVPLGSHAGHARAGNDRRRLRGHR